MDISFNILDKNDFQSRFLYSEKQYSQTQKKKKKIVFSDWKSFLLHIFCQKMRENQVRKEVISEKQQAHLWRKK